MGLEHDIKSISQIGNLVIYQQRHIPIENGSTFNTLSSIMNPRELEVLQEHVKKDFKGNIKNYDKHLASVGKKHASEYGFCTVETDEGMDIYLKKNPNTKELQYITCTDDDKMLSTLYKKLRFLLKNKRLFTASTKVVKKELEDLISSDSFAIDTKHVIPLSNSINEYCLCYIPLEQIRERFEGSATPAWDNFVMQFALEEERELFKAFIYSIFKDDNFGRQLLWLQGVGFSGKSTIVSVLVDKLNAYAKNLAIAMPNKLSFDKYGFAGHDKARLAIISDTKERAIFSREEIFKITGNDYITIQSKYKDNVNAIVYNKVIIASNLSPFVSLEKLEESSRMLYLKLDSERSRDNFNSWYKENKGNWRKSLEQEFERFLANCATSYYKYLTPEGNFNIPDILWSKLEDSGASSYRGAVTSFIDNCLEKSEGHNLVLSDIQEKIKDFMGYKSCPKLLQMELHQQLEKSGHEIRTLSQGGVKVITIINTKFKAPNLTYKELQRRLAKEMSNGA
jgi:hypothetical protein